MLGCICFGGKVSVSTKKVEAAVKEWPVRKTQRLVRGFVQFCNFYAKVLQLRLELEMFIKLYRVNG
jgi:hypothetical protein